MITKQENGKFIISAGEVGIYAVCPLSWKIKSIDKSQIYDEKSKLKEKGLKEHKSWEKKNSQIYEILKSKTLILYLTVFSVLSCLLLFKDNIFSNFPPPATLQEKFDRTTFFGNIKYNIAYAIYQLIGTNSDVFIFIIVLISAIAVIDIVKNYLKTAYKETGIRENSKYLQIDGNDLIPTKDYISKKQGVSGRPDAILKENGFIIPVEIKPLAKKLKDRYVFQLLVYINLMSEFYKKDVPYGYLILGNKKKRIKINNTQERQKALSNALQEMQDILQEKRVPVATPTPQKCQNCTVAKYCQYKI